MIQNPPFTHLLLLILTLALLCLMSSCNRNVARSKKNIDDLHKCGLLVRLPNLDDQVGKLSRAGFDGKASRLSDYNTSYNRAIMADFTARYDFSDVFFFYSDDTQLVLDMQTEGIFLNNKLERDKSIKLSCENFLVMIYGDKMDPDVQRDTGYWILKDNRFKTLQKPFPYKLLWSPEEITIHKFNKRFKKYHQRVQQ